MAVGIAVRDKIAGGGGGRRLVRVPKSKSKTLGSRHENERRDVKKVEGSHKKKAGFIGVPRAATA